MKRMSATIFLVLFGLSFCNMALAAEQAASFEDYVAVVESINNTYETEIVLYSIPSWSVSEFEAILIDTVQKSNYAARQMRALVNLSSANVDSVNNELGISATSTGTDGKAADEWTVLYCKNVTVGPKANVGNEVFLSASSSNIRSREAHPFLYTRTITDLNEGVNIYDSGATLYIWQTGTMKIYNVDTGFLQFEYPGYSAAVYCTVEDSMWM